MTVQQPRADQIEAIDAAVGALTREPGQVLPASGLRTQVIRCTGSGKSLIATRAAMALPGGRVLEFVPTLGLLTQTAQAWRAGGWRSPIIGVSSLRGDEAGFPNTTDIDELVEWTHGLEKVAILATYASLAPQTLATVRDGAMVSDRQGLITRAFRGETSTGRALDHMDLIIVDEAHRTSGSAAKPWAAVHDNTRVLGDRRLYMTATPRLWEPAGGEGAERGTAEIASMEDDPCGTFGQVCHNLPLAEGIRRGLVAPYEVVVVEIEDPQAGHLQARDARSDEVRGERLASLQTALLKALAEEGAKHTLTFHARTREAEAFAAGLKDVAACLWKDDPELYPDPEGVWADWLCGEHSAARRTRVLDGFSAGIAADGRVMEKCVLSSVKLLGEGVDTRQCDSVFWADLRGSMPDLVQAVGRSLRMQPGEGKVAKLIVPVLLGPGDSPERMLTSKAYDGLARLLAALAAHDARLVEALAPQEAKSRSPKPKKGPAADPHVPGNASGQVSAPALSMLKFATPRDPAELARFIRLRSLKPAEVYWSNGIEASAAYVAHVGDLRVPYGFRTPKDWKDCPAGFPLGVWIADARRAYGEGRLSEDHTADLDALGMVWSERDLAFDEGLAAARGWATEHQVGLAAPVDATWNGYPVGGWLKKQRAAARRADENARLREEGRPVQNVAGALTEARRDLLEDIDPGWCPAWPVSWQRAYRLVVAHLEATGSLPAPLDQVVVMGEDLGRWAQAQRTGWDQLSPAQQWLLENVLRLEAVTAPPARRRSRMEMWTLNLMAAERYREREGHLDVPRAHVEAVVDEHGEDHAVGLGSFIANSRKRVAKLAPERRDELSALGIRWK
ncbi:DEAD/DEAH box helicase [Streptomyces lydicus]|uniref:DEAD/DEAH box helicase n=1 Tax=Streptomyces lydicus TaxID=47763 RepID=UPI0036E2BD88